MGPCWLLRARHHRPRRRRTAETTNELSPSHPSLPNNGGRVVLGGACRQLPPALLQRQRLRIGSRRAAAVVIAPGQWEDRNKPYELIAVCLWSVVGVALSTLLMWLALGGYL